MLKVVCIVDKVGTALDRLAKGVAPYHSNLDYKVIDVHPKRPDANQLAAVEKECRNADIIDSQYYRTMDMLREKYPWLKEIPTIQTMNNPYAIYERDWSDYNKVVANNKTMLTNLEEITGRRIEHIPLATDPTFWKFNFDWKPTKRVIMVANRIEAKKGILEAAIACGELGLTFVLVGAVSDREYLYSIQQTGHVEFHEQISDEELRDLYYGSVVHICNSQDNFESGTLPILEAMQCGVPVLTRLVGHVPDFYDGNNLKILEGSPQDVQGIIDSLSDMINDSKALETMRQKAWNTAKNFNMERRAYAYQRLYRSFIKAEPVTIIVPVYDKPETIRACLNAIAEQDYPNIELIVADDNALEPNKDLITSFAKTVNFPVRYLQTGADDYGLARARNEAAIEATGDILVFCDQRQIMAPNAVSVFVENLVPKTWLNGNKGGGKTEFVENFSCVSRTDFIEFGMFSERMDCYGGLSQETRNRLRAQGMRTVYIEDAKAIPMGKSSNRNRKKQEIIRAKNRLWKMGL